VYLIPRELLVSSPIEIGLVAWIGDITQYKSSSCTVDVMKDPAFTDPELDDLVDELIGDGKCTCAVDGSALPYPTLSITCSGQTFTIPNERDEEA